MAALTRTDLGAILARQGILIAFVFFMIGFTIANERFIDPDNIMGVVRSSAILGVMALGVTFVVISGNLDLSVGSMMSFSTIVVLDLHDKIGPTAAIPAMFAMTMCLGALIGFLVGYLKLNSLIVTLGMLSAIHGLTLTYSGGKNMDIADKEATWFGVFGQGEIAGIPVPILIFVLLAAVLGLVLARTPFGRKVYAVGGNGVAATFSGVRRARVVFARGSGRRYSWRCLLDGRRGHNFQNGDRRVDTGFHPERIAACRPPVLCTVCCDLDHYHPCRVARHRGQARQALVTDRVMGG